MHVKSLENSKTVKLVSAKYDINLLNRESQAKRVTGTKYFGVILFPYFGK
jgi:hypothetical protein